jgi:hypothetical protein
MSRPILNSKLLAAALSLSAASGAVVAEEHASISAFTRLVYSDVMTTAPGFTFSRNIGILRACGQKELAAEVVEASRPMLFYEVAQAMRRNQPSGAGLSVQELVEVPELVVALNLVISQGAESTATNTTKRNVTPDKWSATCAAMTYLVQEDLAKFKRWVRPSP